MFCFASKKQKQKTILSKEVSTVFNFSLNQNWGLDKTNRRPRQEKWRQDQEKRKRQDGDNIETKPKQDWDKEETLECFEFI